MPRYAYTIEGRKADKQEDSLIDAGFFIAANDAMAEEIADSKAADVEGYESVEYSWERVA